MIGSRLFRAVGATFVVAFVAVFGAYYVAHLETNPHVYTDVPLYLPFETVHITATGMDTAVSYDVVVVRPDGSVATAVGDGSLIPPAPYDAATADINGEFAFDYQLMNLTGFYDVNVYRTSDTAHATLIATVTFEDAIIPNLDQCANGSPAFGDRHCDWRNGDLNNSNSSYLESQTIPFRYQLKGFPANNVTHTFHINYDFSGSSGAKGYDFLTKYNVTQTGADVCSGSAAAPVLCPIAGIPPVQPAQCFNFPSVVGQRFCPGVTG